MVLMTKSNVGRECVKLVLALTEGRITRQEFWVALKQIEKLSNGNQLTLDFKEGIKKEHLPPLSRESPRF